MKLDIYVQSDEWNNTHYDIITEILLILSGLTIKHLRMRVHCSGWNQSKRLGRNIRIYSVNARQFIVVQLYHVKILHLWKHLILQRYQFYLIDYKNNKLAVPFSETKVSVKDPLVALMSAVGAGKTSSGDGNTTFLFEQKVKSLHYHVKLHHMKLLLNQWIK